MGTDGVGTDGARPLAVVDIDGVLADVGHRLHHLERRPKDWKAFFAAACSDPPHPEGLALAAELAVGHDVVLLTGRPEHCRADTEAWMADHGVRYTLIVMRPAGNRRAAAEVKVDLLGLLAADRTVAVLVDDDPAVIAAAEAAGYRSRLAPWGRPAESLRQAQEVEGRT
ncbi:MAG: hypothetical protein M3535_06985 [Actinomycetota bacterium]|nr:hypothetical protein [Actinomycetota bacterium]MDQ3353615.1 hypothetical protein [Actinomycetota bacterium]